MTKHQLDALSSTWISTETWLKSILDELHRKYKQFRTDLTVVARAASSNGCYGHFVANYYILAMYFQTLCSTNDMYVHIFNQYVDKYSFYMNKMTKVQISKQMEKQYRIIRNNLAEHKSDLCEPIAFNDNNSNQFIEYCILSGNVLNNQILDQQMEKCSKAQRQKIQNIQLLQIIIAMQESTIADGGIEPFERIVQYKDLSSAYELAKHGSISNFYKREINILENELAKTVPEMSKPLTEVQLTELIRERVENKCRLDQLKMQIAKRKKQSELSGMDNDFINNKFLEYSINKWHTDIENYLKSTIIGLNEIFKINTDLNKVQNLLTVPNIFKESDYYKMIIEQYVLIKPEYETQSLAKIKNIFVDHCYAEGLFAKRELNFATVLIEFLNTFPKLDAITDSLQLKNFCENNALFPQLIKKCVRLKMINPTRALVNVIGVAKELKERSNFYFAKQVQEELIAYLVPPAINIISDIDKNIIKIIGTNIAISQVINGVENILHDQLIDEINFVASSIIHVDVCLKRNKWHGKNLVMIAPKAIVHGVITLDVSGQDNQTQHTARGHSAQATNKTALHGRDGFPGESGGNVSVWIDELENACNLTIKSNGGNGGDGEDGGDGKDGENGAGISLSNFEQICSKAKNNDMKNLKDFKEFEILEEWKNEIKLFYCSSTSSYILLERTNKQYTIKMGYSDIVDYEDIHVYMSAQFYLLCSGGLGSPGEIGGEYGFGGQGGYSGNIETSNKLRSNIKILHNQGKSGENGKTGGHGQHGKNGWDIGYLQDHSKSKVYGTNLNSKINLEYFANHSDKLYVTCPYMDHLGKPRNVSMNETSIQNKRVETYQSNVSCKQNRERQHHALANRKKNISHDNIVSSYSHIVNKNHLKLLKNELSNKMKCALEDSQQEEIRKDVSTEVTIRRQIIDSDIKNNKISVNSSPLPNLNSIATRTNQEQPFDAASDLDRNVSELIELIYKNENTTASVKENLNKIAQKLSVSKSFPEDIRNWKKQVLQRFKANQNNADYMHTMFSEMLVVVDEVIFRKRKIRLRATQKLAVIILLTHQRNILEQVTTGEGKSLIVVAAAIIKALCGGKVDIVTSSPVLAIRDAVESKDLFNFFDINVSHNCMAPIEKRRLAYSANQVIYGVLCNFQRDYLLDRFYGKNILGDRNFENVIIDEVDSLLLDRGVNMLYLTNDMPGFDKLESVYIFIWEIINSPINNMQGVMHNFNKDKIKEVILRDIYGLIKKEDLKVVDPQFNDEQINSLWECLIKENVIDEHGFSLIENENKYNPNSIKLPSDIKNRSDKIVFLISSNIRRKRHINIPNYLRPFVVRHVESWISNAINAFLMNERVDYVVDVDRSGASTNNHPVITILDKDTGTDQTNSEWSDALHQFLQLKHGCKLTAQSLKSVFISNISYFKLYRHMYGLTGTLGSLAELEILKKMHEVDFVTIPTTRLRMFVERSPILCRDRSDWIDTIISDAKATIAERRSILIICESVLDVEELKRSFSARCNINVITYTRDYNKFIYEGNNNELEPLKIIIATNLAGRGTDIKLNKQLQSAGGLHVCLTYLPSNNRVEEQAFGRAARCGQKGSGQLIMFPPNEHYDRAHSIETYTECRDRMEKDRLLKIVRLYETEIKTEETCFRIFRDEYERLEGEFVGKKVANSVREFLLQCCLDDWAVWLNEHEIIIREAVDKSSQHIIFQKLNDFIGKIKKQPIDNWTEWRTNPFQKIILAKHRVELPKIKYTVLFVYDQHYDEEEKNEDALKLFNEVIADEPKFSAAAHYYKAYTLIKTINWNKEPLDDRDKNSLKLANDEFRKALHLFEQYIAWAYKSSATVANLKHNMSDSIVQIKGFEEQQRSFIIIYEEYIASIYSLVGRMVTPATFMSTSINNTMANILYFDLLKAGILNKPKVNANIPADEIYRQMNNFENDYGLAEGVLHKYLRHMRNEPVDEKQLKSGLLLPSREVFWKSLVDMEILYDEEKYVIINNIEVVKCVSQTIRKQRLQYEDDSIFLYEIKNVADQFVFNKKDFIQEMGKEEYKMLKSMINFNKKAKIDVDAIVSDKIFPKFDGITAADFKKIKCSAKETALILKELVKSNVLIGNNQNDIYRLKIKHNEIVDIKLSSFPVYKNAVIRLLHCCFAFRIALQQLVEDHESKCKEDVHIKLQSKIHRELFFDLMSQNAITPVSVTTVDLKGKYNEWKNSEKFTEYKKILPYQLHFDITKEIENIERVLQDSSGLLYLSRNVTYRLKPLAEHCENQKDVNAEEMKLVRLNGLGHFIENYRTLFQKFKVWFSALANIFTNFVRNLKSLWTEVQKVSPAVKEIGYLLQSISSNYFDYTNYLKLILLLSTVISSIPSLLEYGWETYTLGCKLIGTAYCQAKVIFFEESKNMPSSAKEEIQQSVAVKRVLKHIKSAINYGLNSTNVDVVINNHIQAICTFISDHILEMVQHTFEAHNMSNKLLGTCALYEKAAATAIINNLTTEFFSPVRYTQEFVVIANKLKRKAHERILYEIKNNYICGIDQWAEHLEPNFHDIKSMINHFLDDIKIANPAKSTEVRELESLSYENWTLEKWKSIICRKTVKDVEENILRPLVRVSAEYLLLQETTVWQKKIDEINSVKNFSSGSAEPNSTGVVNYT